MFTALTLFGTRPEIIKLTPVLQALSRRSDRVRSVVVSSSQHTDLLSPHLAQFGIAVDHDLQIMQAGQSPSSVLMRCMERVAAVLDQEAPDVVIVQGDTTTALAGALAAFYARIPVAHVEAGLRTGDLASPFPEEAHRLLIARVTRWHFAATRANARILLAEDIPADNIHLVGNPVVDAVKGILEWTAPSPSIEALLAETEGRRRLILTTHRRENFGGVMGGHLAAIRAFVQAHDDVELIFPVHPNPAVRAAVAGHLPPGEGIRLIEPLNYSDFVHLANHAWLIASDSGGIQEEAPTLGKPLIVLRDTTERPEAIDCGIARLAGHDPAELSRLLEQAYGDTDWVRLAGAVTNPFGDGRAGERIGSAIVRRLEGRPVRTVRLRSPGTGSGSGSGPGAGSGRPPPDPTAPATPPGLASAPASGLSGPRDPAASAADPAQSADGIPCLVEQAASPGTRADSPAPAAAASVTAAVPLARMPPGDRPKVTIVLPAYNEERDLPELLPRIRAALEARTDYRILVVDDGSHDATAEIVTAFARTMPVTLIQHPVNQGLGAAIRTGLKAAAELDGVVVTLDADNSQGPELIPEMLERIGLGVDVVIASRFQPGAAEVGVPRHRVMLSHGASLFLRTLIGYPGVRDYSCGFRAYRVETLRQLIDAYGDNFLREKGFACMVELLVNLRRIRANIVEVPLVLRYDLKEGASKMRIMRTFRRYLVVVARGELALARKDEAQADRDLRRAVLGEPGANRQAAEPGISNLARPYGA